MRLPTAAFLLMTLVSSLPSSGDWIESGSLEGLEELTAEDLQRIGTLVKHRTIGYTFRDEDVRWHIHRGNLTLPDHFDNADALIVDGDLEIQGIYDDYGKGSGVLIVLGDFAAEHVFSWNGFYVRGAVRSSGLVYGVYNDWAFEVDGGVSARGIVMDDHSADYQTTRADFEINNLSLTDEEEFAKAMRLLVPDLLTDPNNLELYEDSDIHSFWPSYETATKLAYAGRPIFRSTPASQAVVDDTLVAIAAKTNDRQLLALLGRDSFCSPRTATPKSAPALSTTTPWLRPATRPPG